MTTYRPSVVVPFKPVDDAAPVISRADIIMKRAETTLADLERRLEIVEAHAKPPGASWR